MSCLEYTSGSSGPPMHAGEWPEQVARSCRLPDDEHIKWFSVNGCEVRTVEKSGQFPSRIPPPPRKATRDTK